MFRKHKGRVVFESFVRVDNTEMYYTKELYSIAHLLSETMGWWGAAHVIFSLLSLVHNRASYMRHILSKLFMIKSGDVNISRIRAEMENRLNVPSSSPSFKFSYIES